MAGPGVTAGTARTAGLGAALLVVYVVVAAATSTWAPGRMRPLFDGFGSHPGQYNWVNPPREFAEGNQRPESARTEVEFDGAASAAASAAGSDGQALAALVPGALAANGPDTGATLRLEPVDPGRLGALPAGLRAEGNAYLVAIDYEPSGTDVTTLATPGTVGLTSAAPADTLLYSPDGRAWVTRPAKPLTGNNGLTGPLDAAGYYLAASHGEPRALGGSGSGSGAGVVLVLLALAVPVALAWLLLSRRRPGARTGQKGPPPRGARRPPAGGGGRSTPGAGAARKRAGSRPPGRR